jgi:Arrestin (or S-antigen), N-terminal domain
MGNRATAGTIQAGKIHLVTNHTHYMTGQLIQGTVEYELEKDMPADAILIDITGKERLLWDGYDPKATSKKHPGKIYLNTQIYKQQYVIHKFAPGSSVKAGKSQIPFKI